MSTLKVGAIRGTGASADALTVNATDGTCTIKATNNLSNRNLIINGAMQVAQRGTSSTDTGFQTLDRFAYYKAGTQTQSQAAIASATSGPYASGFRKCYKVVNGSNTAGNTDAATFQYTIEDQDLACSGWNHTDPNSKLTLSFWARSSVAQTFYFQIRTKHGTNQGYWSSYALSANTWTKVTKTIPGYANIELANDTGQGFNLSWNTYYGTDSTGSGGLAENTWGAFAGGTSTPDQTVTWQNTNGATFELAGVQLEVGDYASDFQHRSYDEELSRCQRYYQVIADTIYDPVMSGALFAGDMVHGTVPFHKPMRDEPSMVKAGGSNWLIFRYTYTGTTSNNYVDGDDFNLQQVSKTSANVRCTSFDTGNNTTMGMGGVLYTQHADALLAFSAEF